MMTSMSVRGASARLRAFSMGLLLFLAPLAPALAAGSDGGVIVTDLTGTVTYDGKPRESLTILSVIQPEARVRLGQGARLTTLSLGSGDEFVFAGPALVQFRPGEPQVLEGPKPEKRPSTNSKAGKGIKFEPSGMSQAAYVMRGFRTSSPIRILAPLGMRVLDANPEFQWQAVEPGAKYRFRLIDDAGNSILDSEGQATSVKLPAAGSLREGVNYSWNVSTTGQDGALHVGRGSLSLASSELRASVDELRPGAGAPVSERVTFAVWLTQMGLVDEARVYWKALAAERPEDPQLKSLVAQ